MPVTGFASEFFGLVQATVHPEQDRVLTIREYARLQGFPDYYRFCGTVKERYDTVLFIRKMKTLCPSKETLRNPVSGMFRYCQIGNAVAVPVSRALGYAMGMAFQKLSGNEPLMTLPPKFSHSTNAQLAKSLSQNTDSNP